MSAMRLGTLLEFLWLMQVQGNMWGDISEVLKLC